MANEYLDLIDQPENPQAGGNPYLDLIDESHAAPAGMVRAVGDSNPDDVARQKRIAGSLGIPLAAVEADPAFATREAKARAIEAASQAVRQKFTDADFARLAHDDVENLTGIEQAFSALKKTGKAAVSGLRSGSAGAVGLARVPFDLINAVEQPLVDSGARQSVPFKHTAQWLADWQNEIAGTAKAEMPKADGNLGAGYYSGIGSLTRNVAALPMAFLPGGQKAALTTMVAPVGGEAYGEARDHGLSLSSALTYAGSQAAIEYATEKLPLTKLLGDLKAGTSFIKTLAHNAALEVPGEQLATALQDLNDWAVLNPDKPFSAYIAERPDAAAQTLIATLVGTGGQVTLMEGIGKAVGYAEKRSNQAQRAEQGAAFLENLNNLAKASKVAQRDPESFQSFIAQATEDGPVQNVFIDGRFLMQSGMASQLADMSPAVREQLDRAILTGGDIAIPVDEYAARIATTDLAPQLLDHLKTEPDGFSRAEATTFMENQAAELEAEVGRILADKQGDDTFKASQEAVKAQILADMNQSGRFTEAKNEADAMAYSSYYAARAAQLGVTPEELYQQHRVKFVAQGMEGQRFDQEGKLVTDTPAFKNWFGDSKVADADGKPLVMYRGSQNENDPNDPNILNQSGGGTGNRAAFSPETLTVAILKGADLSSVLHEGAHFFFENDIFLASELVQQANAFGYDALKPGEKQILADVSKLMSWHGIQGGIEEQLRTWHTMDFEEKRSHHERTAESFEKYLFEGRAPSIELAPYFQKFRAWMLSVYRSITDFLTRNPEAGKLNDEVRAVFDRMLATNEQIQLAEQGRSMMPLFASAEQAGMTTDEFAAYHAQGIDATNDAIEDLQGKGLRDLQWLHNARGRAVKRLQKESNARRAEVMMEARHEVMSQPLYRAWVFLTGKVKEKAEAQTEHELEVDDWKQRRTEAMDAARTTAKAEAWEKSEESKRDYESGRGKGMAKGQLLARQKKDIDLIVARAALDWDRSNPRPETPATDSAVFDLGEQVYGKINRAALDDMGIPPEITAHIKKLRMTAVDGMHPDMAADMLGFSSGDELVRTLAAAVPPKDAINALTDRRMLEAYGELATPEAIEREADKAIHNEARARMVATEMNALAKAAGKPRVMASAAKEFALAMISRLKVRDIRPGQYSSAAVRAAKATEAAVKAGNTAEAAAEKRNHLVNLYATRAAHDAQDEVDSGLRYFKRFDKRSKTLDPEYQDQIEAMLERFDLRRISNKALDRRASLAQWIESQREVGIEPDIPPELENEAFRKSYKDMTVEEFRGLVDTVKQIEHLGRLKNKLLTAQDQREFAAIVDEVSASIIDNGGKERQVELEEPGRFTQFIENFRAGHRKLASLVRQMDGGKDAGPFWRVFVRGMNDAGTREASMVEDATVRLTEIYRPMLELKGGLNGDKRFLPAINASLTRAGRLSVALNWGNETNRMRVVEGDGWTEYQVQEILNTLTRAEWQFVQDVWAFIDSYWPQIEAKEKRVTGRAPDKVKALPFTVMVDGENVSLAGGYYPIKYDSNRDDRAEKHEAAEIAEEMKRGAYTRASTRRGHTKARTESVKRPVRKTLDVITQHVGEVTHDLAWHEWLIDANRLIDAKPINQAIRTHYGTAVVRTMKDALTGIAAGDMGRMTALDTALLYLRANVSRSTMGFSLTTAFLQPFGLLQSAVRIGGKHVMHGIGRWAGDIARMESTLKWVGDKSDFMRLRSKTFNRELHEIKNRVSHGHSKIRTVYDASLFMLMQKMQMVADIPTWIGAYDKALADGVEDADAVALADQAVLDSQGGGQNKDMAEIQRKHPLLTMFYSYFNTTLNLAAESTAQTDFKNPLAVAGWLSDMMLLMVIPALGPAMILAMMRGESCWEEGDCVRELTQAQLGYTLGTVVGVREMSGMAEGYDYAGPPVGRVVADLGKFGTQVSQGEVDEAAVLSAVRLFGTALGIPTVQIVRSWRGWQAWDDGEAPTSSILMGPPQKD